MGKSTIQMAKWMNEFGKEYTDRNIFTLEELNELYRKNYGITRIDLNSEFIDVLDRGIKILEVGSNVGTQLLLLQAMGFKNLYGIEINSYAVELSKVKTKNINIIQGSALDIPYKDGYFDLVFTSGVLIHISPSDIEIVMREIYRCTKEYIWGFEYYADKYTDIVYRGQENLLWKANFAKLYLDLFKDIELIKETRLRYLNDDNIDTMFLLKKKRKR